MDLHDVEHPSGYDEPMSAERRLIDALRAVATHPAARGLCDDAAVLPAPLGRDLVLTHDMLVEGVHFLADDPPGDVAWKLVAVNLSDLAAKAARPIGLLLGFGLTGRPAWDEAFIAGLGRALAHFGVPLLGGDTVAQPAGDARVLGLTAIGQAAPGGAPDRRGARAGDLLYVTGTIGDAGLGLRIARGEIEGPRRLLKAYRLPMPRLAEGLRLGPIVHAMADISDGLLIDAGRIADASGLGVRIDLESVPMSEAALEAGGGKGGERDARLAAIAAGDDYQLLCAVPPEHAAAAAAIATPIGRFQSGQGVKLFHHDVPMPLPERLGYEHG